MSLILLNVFPVKLVTLKSCWLSIITLLQSGSFQFQIDSVYLNLSNISNISPHSLILCKLANFGFVACYIDWFHNYLTDRHLWVHISASFPYFYNMKFGRSTGARFSTIAL